MAKDEHIRTEENDLGRCNERNRKGKFSLVATRVRLSDLGAVSSKVHLIDGSSDCERHGARDGGGQTFIHTRQSVSHSSNETVWHVIADAVEGRT